MRPYHFPCLEASTRMNRHRLLITAVALSAALPSIGCQRHALPDPGIPYDPAATSEKLAAFIYKEEGRLYLLTVGVNAARFHDKDFFVPLTVLVGNKTKTALNLSRESFTLVDPANGARYHLADLAEVRRQGRQAHDRRLMDEDQLYSKVDGYQRTGSNFFPNEELLNDQVELHQFQYILENLYFPRPDGDLLGKPFELHVNGKGLAQPLFIVFEIPAR